MPKAYFFQPMKPREIHWRPRCDFATGFDAKHHRVIMCQNQPAYWAEWMQGDGKLCRRPAAVCQSCMEAIEKDIRERFKQDNPGDATGTTDLAGVEVPPLRPVAGGAAGTPD